ncbi:MAG: HAD family hydrolase [Gammaproteobacteria bacterium]|nr:MAG: HAD family hydrolase [Gammaproteobacteria bacterium]
MALAIFDLDNTLLAGDSDYLWGRYLVDQGIVDVDIYEGENQRFYNEYKQGKLDIMEFLAFALKPLAQHSLEELFSWRYDYIQKVIKPIVSEAAINLVESHRRNGDILLIITATNRFVTEPIAKLFNIDHLLATDPEIDGTRYTGKVDGIPCYRDGKVTRLNTWLEQTGHDLEDSYFYSDSHNDLPLLELVDHPIAVDPDAKLLEVAAQRNWSVISLRT